MVLMIRHVILRHVNLGIIGSSWLRGKKNQTKEKCNQLNLMDIQPLLGNNHRLPLSHMDKSYIWFEEKNQCINEFSIGYMMNPNLSINKAFKEQVTKCMKTKFGFIIYPIENSLIH